MSYPDYSRAERVADGVVHVIGVCFALAGATFLFWLWAVHMDWPMLTSTIIYSAALIAMLSASAAYHICAHTRARPYLRRLDHAAIYVKIAGTFTPLSVMLGTAFGYAVLALIWIFALIGAGTKLLTERGKMTTGWVPYMVLGWAGILLFIPLSQVLPPVSMGLILAGGLLYTGGVVFYCSHNLRFATAIWHGFILMATACCYMGISAALASAAV